MPRSATIQSNFTSGELDPLLKARVDVQHYYNGAERMRNVLPLPQGGFTRRPGLLFENELPETLTQIVYTTSANSVPRGGTAANANDDSETTVVKSTEPISTLNPYVLFKVFLSSNHIVNFADVVLLSQTVATTNGAEAQWQIQYSTDDATYTTLSTNFDVVGTTNAVAAITRRVTAPTSTGVNASYLRVAKIGGTDGSTGVAQLAEFRAWTFSGTPSEVRLVPHEFSTVQRYLGAFTDRNLRIFKAGDFQTDIPSPYKSSELKVGSSTETGFGSIAWTQSFDTLLTFHKNYPIRQFIRDGADNEWQVQDWSILNTPSDPFENITITSIQPNATTATALVMGSTSGTSTADVLKFVRGNGGYCQIDSVTGTSQMNVSSIKPFDTTELVAAEEWTLEELVWSSSRGFPVSGVFFQGRLAIGGSRDLPNSGWLSKAGNVHDFNVGKANASDAIQFTLDTDDVAAIYQVAAGRHLQFFTQSSEFYVPKSEEDALTPSNVTLRRTTQRGIKQGIKAFDSAGASIFLQAGGKALREFLFTQLENAYTANNLSLLASHLIDDPIDVAFRKSTSTDEADLMLVVNDDGTLTVVVTLRDQEIVGFSNWKTDGTFVKAGVDGSDMYTAIKRQIEGSTKVYLERFDSTLLTDSAVTGAASSTATLAHLKGETVVGLLDARITSDITVSTADGTITFPRASTTAFEAGLHFPDVSTDSAGSEWIVRDMPLEANLPDGTSIGRRKRVVEATLRLKDTKGLRVNGNEVPFSNFGSTLLDIAIPDFTGDKTVRGLAGWDEFAQVTLDGPRPQKATVLGLAKKVAV